MQRSILRLSLCLSVVSVSAQAQDDDSCARWKALCDGSISVVVENDLFGGTDRSYTNGLELQVASGPQQQLPLSGVLSRLLPDRYQSSAPDREWRTGFGGGHVMFTPTDISLDEPDPDDRPYAGWAFVTTSLYSEARGVVDVAELTLGWVGDGAGAGWVQRNWHQLIDGEEPRGWRFQIKDEPGIIARVGQRRYTKTRELPVAGLEWGGHGQISLALGNVDTSANLAGGIRVGRGFRGDHGETLRVKPSLSTASFVSNDSPFGWYVFGDIGGRAIGRDIFLDGNSFRDSPSVRKRHFVSDRQVGAAVHFGRVRTSFTFVRRSEEFFGQDGAQKFGAVAVSIQY